MKPLGALASPEACFRLMLCHKKKKVDWFELEGTTREALHPDILAIGRKQTQDRSCTGTLTGHLTCPNTTKQSWAKLLDTQSRGASTAT